MPEGRTYKTLEEVTCAFAVKSVERFEQYLEEHPDDADEIRAALDTIANGPRNLSNPVWTYMGSDLRDAYIYQVNENIVVMYHFVSLGPVCLLGLVAILDNREF